ncbi:MAG: hypothetical protein ACLQUY_00905 [Ktedonobacterales bacterium]
MLGRATLEERIELGGLPVGIRTAAVLLGLRGPVLAGREPAPVPRAALLVVRVTVRAAPLAPEFAGFVAEFAGLAPGVDRCVRLLLDMTHSLLLKSPATP